MILRSCMDGVGILRGRSVFVLSMEKTFRKDKQSSEKSSVDFDDPRALVQVSIAPRKRQIAPSVIARWSPTLPPKGFEGWSCNCTADARATLRGTD